MDSPSNKTVFITPEEHAMNMDEEPLRETLRQEEEDQRKNEEIRRENEEHDRAWEAYVDDYIDWNDDLKIVFMKHIHHTAPNQAIQTQESQAPVVANQDLVVANQDPVAANQDPVAADLQKKRKRQGKKPVDFVPDEEVVAADEPQVTEDVQKKRKRQGKKPASDQPRIYYREIGLRELPTKRRTYLTKMALLWVYKSQSHPVHPFKVNVIPAVEMKPNFLQPIGIKRIAKVARGWFLGCDLSLDCRGSGEDNEQCRDTVHWRETLSWVYKLKF
nr:hypothetical protein [Tanacetum cinerariifolium]